jgi:hypothetical protein
MAWAPLNFWSGSGPDQAAILVAVLNPKPGADRSSLDTFMAKSEKLAIYQDRRPARNGTPWRRDTQDVSKNHIGYLGRP